MYHVDNPQELEDNLANQVSNSVDLGSSAVPIEKLNSARSAPVGAVGFVADSKRFGGTASVSSQGNRQVVQQR
jgi:hypothetical protein